MKTRIYQQKKFPHNIKKLTKKKPHPQLPFQFLYSNKTLDGHVYEDTYLEVEEGYTLCPVVIPLGSTTGHRE